jgi:hypothetical protein
MSTGNTADDSLTAVVFVYYRYIACSKKSNSNHAGGVDGEAGKSTM